MCFPAPNRKTAFGFLMIAIVLIGLLIASQAKFKFVLMIIYFYIYGGFAFLIGKISSLATWMKTSIKKVKYSS